MSCVPLSWDTVLLWHGVSVYHVYLFSCDTVTWLARVSLSFDNVICPVTRLLAWQLAWLLTRLLAQLLAQLLVLLLTGLLVWLLARSAAHSAAGLAAHLSAHSAASWTACLAAHSAAHSAACLLLGHLVNWLFARFLSIPSH